MVDRLKQLEELKAKREQLIRKKSEAEGRRSEIQATMQETYGVSTVEDLVKLKETKEKELSKCEQDLTERMQAFQNQWGSVLD